MEYQFYGLSSLYRPISYQTHEQPWWDEEDTLTDRFQNGILFTKFNNK